MHDGAQVVCHVVVVSFRNDPKIGAISLLDVVSVYVHVIIPVGTALLVKEAQCMADFVHHNAKLWRIIGPDCQKLLIMA